MQDKETFIPPQPPPAIGPGVDIPTSTVRISWKEDRRKLRRKIWSRARWHRLIHPAKKVEHRDPEYLAPGRKNQRWLKSRAHA